MLRPITPEDFNDALKRYYGKASADDFWEVKGLLAVDGDFCWSDDNAYFIFEVETSCLSYFAFEQNRMETIRHLFHVIYRIVCNDFPFIKLSGRVGRYEKILKLFGHYQRVGNRFNGYESFLWYAGHPESVDKIRKRMKE